MKVLVYVDGSDASYRALERAVELARQGAGITALHVFPPRLDRDEVSHFEIEPEDMDLKFAREVLARVTARFEQDGLAVGTSLAEGAAAEVIRTEAEEGSFDLILMSARREVGGAPFDLAEIVRRKCSLPVEVVE